MLSNIKKAGRVGSLRTWRGTAHTGQLVELFSQVQAPHITTVLRPDGKCSIFPFLLITSNLSGCQEEELQELKEGGIEMKREMRARLAQHTNQSNLYHQRTVCKIQPWQWLSFKFTLHWERKERTCSPTGGVRDKDGAEEREAKRQREGGRGKGRKKESANPNVDL